MVEIHNFTDGPLDRRDISQNANGRSVIFEKTAYTNPNNSDSIVLVDEPINATETIINFTQGDNVGIIKGDVITIDDVLVSSTFIANIDELKKAATEQVGTAVNWLSGFVGGIWSGGVAFFNMLSLILITPLVAFYLLRDWDILVAKINSWLPLDAAPIIREQALQIDKTMAGFIRGQACVCLVLAVYYALALSILGLKAGLLIGIISGILAFVPFIGWAVAFFVSLAMSLTQFEHFLDITFVGIVMIFGALLESYILTPKLVGGRVGLSPIWIIFSMLAGGALFGFLGVLLAVPVAAIIGVLIRFWLNRYLKSVLYLGHDHGFKD